MASNHKDTAECPNQWLLLDTECHNSPSSLVDMECPNNLSSLVGTVCHNSLPDTVCLNSHSSQQDMACLLASQRVTDNHRVTANQLHPRVTDSNKLMANSPPRVMGSHRLMASSLCKVMVSSHRFNSHRVNSPCKATACPLVNSSNGECLLTTKEDEQVKTASLLINQRGANYY